MSRYILSVLFIEGYVALSMQMLYMRKTSIYTGSGVGHIGLIIGIILLSMALGYRYGGVKKDFDVSYLKHKDRDRYFKDIASRIGNQFILVSIITALALNDTIIRLIMIVDGSYVSLFIYSLFFISPAIFLMATTIPLIIRMYKGSSSEEKASRALFLSTIGSFFGSILTSIILFSYLGVYLTTNLILLTLFLFGVYSTSIKEPQFKNFPLYLFSAVICLFLFWGKNKEIVESNEYYEYGVAINKDYKAFKVNGSFSSIIYSNGSVSPYIEYMRSFLHNQGSLINKDILVIGGGGFVAGYGIEDTGARFDYLDIDPKMKEIAEKNFLDDPVNGNYFAVDGRSFLLKNKKKYDVVILDTFTSLRSIPENLSTLEYFVNVKSSVKDGGWVLINIIADTSFNERFTRGIHNTINKSFDYCMAIPLTFYNTYSNIVYQCKVTNDEKVIYTDDVNLSNSDFGSMGIDY